MEVEVHEDGRAMLWSSVDQTTGSWRVYVVIVRVACVWMHAAPTTGCGALGSRVYSVGRLLD
eukprot:4485940-Prymnesium_polylepis.1